MSWAFLEELFVRSCYTCGGISVPKNLFSDNARLLPVSVAYSFIVLLPLQGFWTWWRRALSPVHSVPCWNPLQLRNPATAPQGMLLTAGGVFGLQSYSTYCCLFSLFHLLENSHYANTFSFGSPCKHSSLYSSSTKNISQVFAFLLHVGFWRFPSRQRKNVEFMNTCSWQNPALTDF